MDQESGSYQVAEHLLAQVIAPVELPVFTHPDIAKQYQDGVCNRLDAELADILCGCGEEEQTSEATLIPLTNEAASVLKGLNCIALIQGGQVLPLLDIEQMTAVPTTLQERVQLYHAAARTLLEAIAAIYEDWAESRKLQTRQDDDPDLPCPITGK
jgi:hypothetical protein